MKLDTIRHWFERLIEFIVIVLMIGLAVEVLVGIAFRASGNALAWYDEVASVMLAWLTYYASVLGALKRSHLGFPELVNAMSPAIRVNLVILGEVIVIGFFALMGWLGMTTLSSFAGETLTTIDIPTELTQSVIPIGSVLFIVAELLSLPKVLNRARSTEKLDAPEPSMEALQ